MAARPVPLLSSRAPLTALALLAGLVIGLALAVNQFAGLSLLAAACYLPVVLLNLPAGIALWLPLAFLRELTFPIPVGLAAGVLLVIAWVASAHERRATTRAFVAAHRRLLGLMALMLVWVTLSAAWAADLGLYGADIWRWYTAALLFVIVGTTISEPRYVRMLAGAFVGGAVLSVGFGLLHSGQDIHGRLYGGSGDPNYSAAGYLAAIIVAAGLLRGVRRWELRWLLVAAMGILAAGTAATQSRGAFVSAGVATVAALILYKGRRGQVLALVAVALSAVALVFSLSPSGWKRITHVENDQPRSELWLVAWRMSEDHPVAGVGLNNFEHRAGDYVRRPGTLRNVELIADRPLLAHNSFLEVLADTGFVGALMYIGFLVGCLAATLRAARRFDVRGETVLAELARAIAIAIVAMASASAFLSIPTDQRTWLLLALGPTLLGIASRAPRWTPSASTP